MGKNPTKLTEKNVETMGALAIGKTHSRRRGELFATGMLALIVLGVVGGSIALTRFILPYNALRNNTEHMNNRILDVEE